MIAWQQWWYWNVKWPFLRLKSAWDWNVKWRLWKLKVVWERRRDVQLGRTVCSHCKCPHSAHGSLGELGDSYRSCMLYGGKPICDTCCEIEIPHAGDDVHGISNRVALLICDRCPFDIRKMVEEECNT